MQVLCATGKEEEWIIYPFEKYFRALVERVNGWWRWMSDRCVDRRRVPPMDSTWNWTNFQVATNWDSKVPVLRVWFWIEPTLRWSNAVRGFRYVSRRPKSERRRDAADPVSTWTAVESAGFTSLGAFYKYETRIKGFNAREVRVSSSYLFPLNSDQRNHWGRGGE